MPMNSGSAHVRLTLLMEKLRRDLRSTRSEGIVHGSSGFSSRLTAVSAVGPLKKPSAMEVKIFLLTRMTWSEARRGRRGSAACR